MFFFCILSAAKKITSSINKGFRKCSPQSFSVRCKLSEFRTHEFKSFQNCKYLAVTFRNYFVKNKNYKVKHLCFSALYMLQNVLIVKLAKLYTVNLYVFLSALYMLQHVPIVIILVIVYLFPPKKENDPYFGMGKNTKVMPQYPTIYLFSWEREGILTSQNLT